MSYGVELITTNSIDIDLHSKIPIFMKEKVQKIKKSVGAVGKSGAWGYQKQLIFFTWPKVVSDPDGTSFEFLSGFGIFWIFGFSCGFVKKMSGIFEWFPPRVFWPENLFLCSNIVPCSFKVKDILLWQIVAMYFVVPCSFKVEYTLLWQIVAMTICLKAWKTVLLTNCREEKFNPSQFSLWQFVSVTSCRRDELSYYQIIVVINCHDDKLWSW